MIDPSVLVSRVQFAFTIGFHILFPAFSIGLALFLAVMETAWIVTKKPVYLSICQFWTKIFALTFGMGVVSGLVMELQLGTNWSAFSREVGPVLGALFTYEVMTAFFIEAGFLGVMIFGWKRVNPKLHYFSTLLVFLGVTISAFWILVANSWMQTPAGVEFHQGHFVVINWMQVIFNPSALVRFFHMLVSAYLATAFAMAGILAYYLLRKEYLTITKPCFSFVFWAILILAPVQIFIGDTVGLKVLHYQPMKTAAMEGIWETQKGAPLLLFAIPDQEKQRNYWEIGIPHGASLINTHEYNGELKGLKTVSKQDQPLVAPVFFTFRIMVALGLLMLLLGVISVYLRFTKQFYQATWFLHTLLYTSPIGFIAIICGWLTAELGRQPWVVYGLLRTVDAASPVSEGHVMLTLIAMVLVYGVIFGYFYFYYLFRTIQKGPQVDFTKLLQPFAYMVAAPKEDMKK